MQERLRGGAPFDGETRWGCEWCLDDDWRSGQVDCSTLITSEVMKSCSSTLAKTAKVDR